MSTTIEMVGAHRVFEAREPCYLVELIVRNSTGPIDIGEFTQEMWRFFHRYLQEFDLTLHPKKTRLIEFGRASASRRQREGRGRCETFDFLGFTHICGKTRKNKRFVLWRRTIAKRMSQTLAVIKERLRRRRHDSVGTTGRWLASVIRGWLQYHAVPDNLRLKPSA